MAKENPWFKFEPAEWVFGRIQRQTSEVKVCFMDLMCKYWHVCCEMSLEDAELDFGAENIQVLIKNKIIDHDDVNIYINFLDDQMDGIKNTSKQNSENGKKSAEARRLKKIAERELNDRSTTVQPILTDKIREDNTREEKKKKDNTEKKTASPVFVFKTSLVDYGFKKQLVEDFLKNRITKKLTNTQTSFDSFILEIEKTGLEKNEVFKTIVEKGWGSFKNSWLKDKKVDAQRLPNDITTFKDDWDD